MKLTASWAGLFLCIFVFLSHNTSVSATTPVQKSLEQSIALIQPSVMELAIEQPNSASVEIKPKEHLVESGENLTKIAEQYQTSWQRLFAKNQSVDNPNIINTGELLTIPFANEQLADRATPTPAPTPAIKSNPEVVVSKKITKAKRTTTYAASRGSSSGNTYTAGYCTWYAKSKRPDLPNNLGNADTWVARAAAQGLPTGSVPQSGAIGQKGMHVVFVERVNGDGTVFVSEMNHKGFGVISSRTVPASYFSYIY